MVHDLGAGSPMKKRQAGWSSFSAGHGLVECDRQLDPYDTKMGDPGAITPAAIAAQLASISPTPPHSPKRPISVSAADLTSHIVRQSLFGRWLWFFAALVMSRRACFGVVSTLGRVLVRDLDIGVLLGKDTVVARQRCSNLSVDRATIS